MCSITGTPSRSTSRSAIGRRFGHLRHCWRKPARTHVVAAMRGRILCRGLHTTDILGARQFAPSPPRTVGGPASTRINSLRAREIKCFMDLC